MADLREELPFRTEYAKTGRASCKGCKAPIVKDSIRMAVMVQSHFFDGKQANWHHFDCFFKRFRPKLEEIAHLANLKYDDQKNIEEAIKKAVGAPVEASTAGKSRSRKKKATDDVMEFADFKVEYSKSNRAKCRLCENVIKKDDIRISKLDRESEEAHRLGPIDRWFHVECFVSARDSLGFYGSADKLPFFDKIDEDDRKVLKKKLPATKKPENLQNGSSPAKKPKISSSDEKKLKKQSDLLFKYIEFAKEMKRNDLIALMEKNKIEVPDANQSKFERLADAMTFGVPAKCPECKKGQLVFRMNGYICTGDANEWTKCEYQIPENPKRKEFKVPQELAEKYPVLGKYKYKEGKRLFNPTLKPALKPALETATTSSTNATTSSGALPKKEEKNGTTHALDGYNIACAGKLKTSKTSLKTKLKKWGANLVDSVDRTTLCIISTKKEFDKQTEKILDSQDLSVPVVSEEFIDGIENGSEPIQVINLNRLDNWEIDIEKRFNNLNVKEKMKTAFKSGGSGSGRFEQKSATQRMILKDGNVVDPECEVAEKTHILKEGKDVYNAVLSQVDLARNKNSFYKIQLLKHDSKSMYYIFRSWGRVGTTIGGNILDKYKTKEDAIEAFESIYEEKTQNEWSKRKNFKKKPDCYYPVDVDYAGDDHTEKLNVETSKSTLPKPVQDLICMIFDVQKMKQQMLEFDLDLEKMPLGKLSKKQLLKACSVLKELSILIDKKTPEKTKIKDATNRFYTMIPHNFGTERPPLIDTLDMIKTKTEMLESLLDIEMAFEMINSTNEETKNMDPIDHHYQKLNAKIEPLNKDSEEFIIIDKYLKNTHGSTHNFSLEIDQVFKVERHGEADEYQKHKELDRMLLWHGSRLTNYAGILSQGLRIAPPEAPVTGYMFGKGIYFADMVTKSAGYCYHHTNKNVGFLLLSEVAVGQPWELFDAKDVKKLPKDKHSVKGVGKMTPDPNEWHVLPDGVKVPLGKGVDNKEVEKKCSLLYNEYIVYNTSQVNIKYLLKCKFNTKSLF